MKPRDISVDIEMLRQWIDYNPETGKFYWKKAKQGVVVGMRAGNADARGYLQLSVGGLRLMAHRVAWAFQYGAWPKCQIDHINMDPSDNRICNLREATDAQNKANSGVRKNKWRSRYKGVSWDKRREKWTACIYREGGQKFLGCFLTENEAATAYATAAKKYDGEFARLS